MLNQTCSILNEEKSVVLFYICYILFNVYIIPSPLPVKVHAMLLRCSISKMALESQLEKDRISTV